MAKSLIDVDWSISRSNNLDLSLRRFRRYQEELGHTESTIEGYIGNVKRYLTFSGTDRPTLQDWDRFRSTLFDRKLARATINQYSFSARAYHAMLGEDLRVKRLEPHNEIPYYFDEDDIIKILGAVNNLMHLAMLELCFFACLRSSELIVLDVGDVDLRSLTVRVKGKGGRIASVHLHPECVQTLRQYFEVRPPVEVDGKRPLFFTKYGNRWQRTEFSRMFARYKRLANVTKPGGLHVFGRHSPASIMVKNGCDILTVKELLRHRDIKTTTRYLHISDQTMRLKHNRFLRL